MIKFVKMTEEYANEVISKKTVVKNFLGEEDIKALANYEHSYALLDGNGKVLGVGGLLKKWNNRYEAWAVLDEENPHAFLTIHRVVKRFLNIFDARRIEATVDYNFEAGHRWMGALGFRLECDRMRAFGPDGNDCALYAYIKEDN